MPRKLYFSLLHNLLLKIVIPFFIASGIFLLVTPNSWYLDWFFPRLTGVGALFDATIILAPFLIFRIDRSSTPEVITRQRRSRTRLQNYIAICALLGFAGTLGLFQLNFSYDKLIHFVIHFLFAIALSRFIYRWKDVSLERAIGITIFFLLATGTLWELLEFASDNIFGTAAFGIHGQQIFIDTVFDGALDVFGIITGIVAVKLRKKPWPY